MSYREAFLTACYELMEIREQERALFFRKYHLKRAIEALEKLTGRKS